jgi:hypothetical protein
MVCHAREIHNTRSQSHALDVQTAAQSGRVLKVATHLYCWCSVHPSHKLDSGAAGSTGAVTYGSFVASVRRDISVALGKGNHGIFRARVELYTRASGHARVPSHRVPTAEIEFFLF